MYSPFSSIVARVVCAFEILDDATPILNRCAVNELALVFNESKIDITVISLLVQHFEWSETYHSFYRLHYDEIFDFLLHLPVPYRYQHYFHYDYMLSQFFFLCNEMMDPLFFVNVFH